MPNAIVLHTTRYSDTACIVHLYTAEHGRMQYMVYGNKLKGILRPLSIIEYTSTRRNNAPTMMGTLSNASLLYTPQQSTIDIQRQCVAMFIAEVIINTLRHPMSDKPLYDWLCKIIQHLDQDKEISNLHLQFLLEYASYLGIGIDETEHPAWLIAPATRSERQERLQQMSAYYKEHIEDFRIPKSLDVLMEVFD